MKRGIYKRRSSERLAIKSLGRFKNTSSNPVMVDSDTETKYVCKDSGLSESDVNEDDVSLQQKNKGKRLVFSDSDEDTTVASRQKQSLSKMIKVKQRKKARKKQSAGKDKHMIKKKKKHKKDYESSLQISVPEGRRKKRKRFVVYDSDVDTTIKAKKKQERFSCEGVDVDETKTTIEFWTLDKLHEREALEISGGGFGNGKYIPLSADDCPNKNGSTLQDRPSSSDMYGLEYLQKQLSFLNNLLELTRENKKRLETDLGIMIHQHPGDVKVKKLMVGFEEVFKQKILVEEAEPHNGVNATISKSDAEAYHEHDKDDGESPHSGKKRLEKSHEDSPDSVVNLSDSSPIMKGQVVGIRKSDIKKLKLASAAKSGVSLGNIHQPSSSLGMTQEGVGDVTPKVFIKKKDVVHVDSSPVDKDKHRTPQVNLTVDGGHAELQTTGVLFGNIHEPSFSLGMTQEGIGNVTPNNLG
ncbi:hypothetical protein R6Q59_030140 [Mikania micrantha]